MPNIVSWTGRDDTVNVVLLDGTGRFLFFFHDGTGQ